MRQCRTTRDENSQALRTFPPLLGERAGPSPRRRRRAVAGALARREGGSGFVRAGGVRASVSSNLILGVAGGLWRKKHFRLRDAPPSPLRYDAIAPKPEAKAEKRRSRRAVAPSQRVGATAVRLVTSAARLLRRFLNSSCRLDRTQPELDCRG